MRELVDFHKRSYDLFHLLQEDIVALVEHFKKSSKLGCRYATTFEVATDRTLVDGQVRSYNQVTI